MKNLNLLYKCLLVLAICFAGTVQATPIDGAITFTGKWSTDTGNILTATTIYVTDSTVSDSVGDLASVSAGSSVSWNSLDYVTPVITNPLWSVGGFTFDLANVHTTLVSSSQLGLAGTGILKNASFSDTDAAWTFTGDKATSGSFTIQSFSSGTHSVPEPGTLALFGLGLVGLAGLSIAKKKAV